MLVYDRNTIRYSVFYLKKNCSQYFTYGIPWVFSYAATENGSYVALEAMYLQKHKTGFRYLRLTFLTDRSSLWKQEMGVLLGIPQKSEAYIDDLAQDCSNSIANALKLLQSCA